MNPYSPCFRLMKCQTIVHWYWLCKSVGLNQDVSLLYLLTCWFSRLAFSQKGGQLTPEYSKLSTNRFIRMVKMPLFIGHKMWWRCFESMRHHSYTWTPVLHTSTSSKSFNIKINHCTWMWGLKDVQRNMAFVWMMKRFEFCVLVGGDRRNTQLCSLWWSCHHMSPHPLCFLGDEPCLLQLCFVHWASSRKS